MSLRQVVWLFGVAVLTTLVPPSESASDSGVKIIGGNEVKLNEYPFVVYTIDANGDHVCSGSLVDRRWVVTAAHCLGGFASSVVLGDYIRHENDTTEQVISIEEEIPHPDGKPGFLDHDIGLIKLSTPADIRSEAVAKIPLQRSKGYNKKVMADQKKCRVLGWGGTKSSDGVNGVTNKLLVMRMRIVNQTEAERRGFDAYDFEGMMATEAVYKDACKIGGPCNGDSGAPLVCKKNGKWVLTGVHSFKEPFDGCLTGIKGDANVYEHYTWIESVINA